MAFSFSANLSGSAFRFARHVPDGLLSRSVAFRRGFVFQAGTPPKKEYMSLLIGKEDQHSEDRLLANAWSKDYIRRREKVASRHWSDARALTTPIKRLRKQNGQNREPH